MVVVVVGLNGLLVVDGVFGGVGGVEVVVVVEKYSVLAGTNTAFDHTGYVGIYINIYKFNNP